MPGVDGEFGVLHGHSNLLSLLKAGVIEISQGQSRDLVAIDWGYAEVTSIESRYYCKWRSCNWGAE